MSNFVKNRIEIVGSKKQVKEIYERFNTIDDEGLNQFPDFNKVIPQPDNIFRGDLGVKEKEACKRANIPTWLDWNNENWGTKWNSFGCEKVGYNVFTFETAWGGVPNIIFAMSEKFPDVEFIYEYSDEETGYNCGTYRFKNHKYSENILEGGTKEAYEFAFSLWPDMKENYKLIDRCYIRVDED